MDLKLWEQQEVRNYIDDNRENKIGSSTWLMCYSIGYLQFHFLFKYQKSINEAVGASSLFLNPISLHRRYQVIAGNLTAALLEPPIYYPSPRGCGQLFNDLTVADLYFNNYQKWKGIRYALLCISCSTTLVEQSSWFSKSSNSFSPLWHPF